MRNLRSVQNRVAELNHPVAAHAFDLDDIFYSHGPSTDNPSVVLKRLPKGTTRPDGAEEIASWDAIAGDTIIDLHSFADTNTISVIFESGDITVVRQEPEPGEELIEIVGTIDAGISAAAWSPDEELVAIATKADTLLLMTRDFESLSSITLSAEDVKVSNHVSVGWGKRETQFKGRGAAKALRDPTVPEHIDEGTVSPFDDGRVHITWRGDGQYVAMNSVLHTEPERRIIRIYSREGILDSVSEPINGLESALSWKPSGQVIASVQRRQDAGIDVIFFERNGLRHGEFDLRLSKDEAESIGQHVDLAWNMDSTVLAVILGDRIQLWTMGNYHWYLKQEISTSKTAATNGSAAVPQSATNAASSWPESMTGMRCIMWHPEKSLELAFADSSGRIHDLSYEFVVARGSVTPPTDLGLVAVIDGKTLKVTPLRIANTPPPMALDEIDLPAPALDVFFSDDGTEIVVRHAGRTSKWNCDYAAKPIKRAALVSISEDVGLSNNIESASESRFQLSGNGVLRGRGLQIPGCTSYIATQAHLIYTTRNHLLKFVHLRDDGGELQVAPDEPEKDERCRTIERGAKIVTVMPSAYALVLQMPRGNLETIYPRALVLAGIRHSITVRDYKKAFKSCRTHRVDLNILHDYSPEQFISDIVLFLKQVQRAEYVDLFLSSLSEDNVADTTYKETLALASDKTLMSMNKDAINGMPAAISKVNRICDTFLTALKAQPSPSMQNIVTAHVCKNPPDLESGLRLVSELRKNGKQGELEAAVEHICFLADVNQLYDTALGLYDLDVALLIAQQSQKDPREYLPYLQSLHNLSPLRRQFAIDNDIKRYRKALAHLHGLDAFDEFKRYMANHELYGAAIELCRYDDAKLTELMCLFAEFLNSRNRYKEAGIAYEYVKDYVCAYEVYRSAGMWEECLAAAALAQVSNDELTTIATDLAASLEEAKDFRSAAIIHLEYLHNLARAARLLCKGYHFPQAVRLIATHRQPELLGTVIDPGLIEASAIMTEMLAEMNSQLKAQIPRLHELRQKKTENPMAFLDGGGDGDDADIADNISLAPTDTSTTGTFMTRYTGASTGTLATNATRNTSKNRRREERKRARGKKGTVYEEEYLVNSIARLIERLNSVGDDVMRLVEGLMRRAMRERAVAVDNSMQEVANACRSCMEEVFAPPANTSDKGETPVSGEAQSRPWGGQGVLWEAMTTSEVKRETPNLKIFERLSLLS